MTYSDTKYIKLSSYRVSIVCINKGWLISCITRSSFSSNSNLNFCLLILSISMNLMAQYVFAILWRASLTKPWPPSPIFLTNVYLSLMLVIFLIHSFWIDSINKVFYFYSSSILVAFNPNLEYAFTKLLVLTLFF